MSAQPASAVPIVDPYAFLGFIHHPDGSVTRQNETTPLSAYSGSPDLVVKDIQINPSHGTSVRIFLPKKVIESSHHDKPSTKLPLIVFVHGGGFIAFSAASTIFAEFHRVLTTHTPAAFVSVNYRLCPEHRLPTAYDDAWEVLQWVKNSPDELLMKYADFSNTFLAGTSAGANIAYNVGLRVAFSERPENPFEPMNIRGLILIEPFFGGENRTPSEIKSIGSDYAKLPPIITDIMWEVSLPVGANRDHEYCNPIMGWRSHPFEHIRALGWKILVAGFHGDPLSDRQSQFAQALEDNNVQVVAKFHEGGYHGVENIDPSALELVAHDVRRFVILAMIS